MPDQVHLILVPGAEDRLRAGISKVRCAQPGSSPRGEAEWADLSYTPATCQTPAWALGETHGAADIWLVNRIYATIAFAQAVSDIRGLFAQEPI